LLSYVLGAAQVCPTRGTRPEIALRLSEDGALVIVHYSSNQIGADETVQAIKEGGGDTIAYRADIARRQAVLDLFQEIDRNPGRLDIVVNSSGVSGGGSLANLDEGQLEWMLGGQPAWAAVHR
jgi:3-oxoacyl-[acyl-carrier protein] reductase